MTRLIQKAAALFGCSLIPNWRLGKLPMARRLSHIFSQYDIDTVIDVGANEGQFRDFLRDDVGFSGQIESFEPIPELSEKLRIRAQKDGNWAVHPSALGSTSGQLELNVMSGSDFSSFLQPKQVETSYYNLENTLKDKILVNVSTLDAHFGNSLQGKKIYLKLDTQGFDIEALRGGENFVKSVSALQTEISFIPIYDGMNNYSDSIRIFGENGFDVADMFLVTGDTTGRAMEFDCIMVRQDDSSRG